MRKTREPGRASLIAAQYVSLDEGRFSAHSAAIKHSHGEAIITDDGSDTYGFKLEENALFFCDEGFSTTYWVNTHLGSQVFIVQDM